MSIDELTTVRIRPKKSKRYTIWVVHMFFISVYLALFIQVLIQLALTKNVESVLSVFTFFLGDSFELPNMYLNRFITGLGWITSSYLGFEQAFKFTKTLNVDIGTIYVDRSKDKDFAMILKHWFVLLFTTMIINVFVKSSIVLPLESVILWTSILGSEYVIGRKVNKVASAHTRKKKRIVADK